MNQIQDDEIDLFQCFQTLWDGKWIISAFVAITVLLGGTYIAQKNDVYQARLMYSINTIPPFYERSKVTIDFQQKFYSNKIFNDWKEIDSNASLVFEDFSITEIIDGYVLSKNPGSQLATLMEEKKEGFFVLIKSNQLKILDDFFKYAEYINKLMTAQYINRARDELNIIETRFKDFSTANDAITSQLLNIDRYVVSAESGANALTIKHASKPEKISPKIKNAITLFAFLGAMLGIFYVFSLKIIRDHKQKRAKL